MSDIFISYKREEQAIARKVADALESEGWTVWWDPKLRAGEHFDDVIEKALNEAKCVIVLWSERSVQSRYVKDEATYALDQDKLVPVAIENVNPPFRFRGVHTLSLLGWDGSKDFSEFRRLIEDVSAILNPLGSVVEKEIRGEPITDRPQALRTGGTRSLAVRVHRGYFSGQHEECHFVNLTNLSQSRIIEVTHVWYADDTHRIPIIQPSRLLPVRLELDESWETWLETSKLPYRYQKDAMSRFRARISTGEVFASVPNPSVPPMGFVPGGPTS